MKFTLSMPPSINNTYAVSRGGKIPFYKKRPVRDWEYDAGWEIKRQWIGRKTPKNGSIAMTINWFYQRNRDIDAGIKVLLDLFQKQRVYLNDSQIRQMMVTKEQDVKNPRVEVTIDEIS
jgi:Holliday junction resolvase RusA-like endonuclease